MSLLRRTRTEVAGAWRSLRYDMGRTPAEPPAGGPDMTSTGMGTFGIDLPIDPAPAPVARRPRRALAVTAFATLTVAGAAGAYLAVVNGLGSLVSETTAAAGTSPPRAAATTAVGMGSSASPVRVPPATTAATVPAAPAPVPTDPAPPRAVEAPPPPPPPANTPIRSTKPTNPESHGKPPVPTPTAPTSSPSPTTSPSPSSPDSSDPGSPGPSPSDSASPGNSVSPSQSWHGRRHKRNH
ncbi:hypothetical protein [Paractinoplanes lichenicola]|uniref:Uncharacterized protein n=1 Tax=Paractinoplanes lichenicola TaxID=2802976 RepID=A0ABS1VPL3_9ACTN|nr:hypothetical protein [Actinoplanes lichenicola]MBL7256528.1 hypothetical protein [Actinoplanes lichenicola]